MLFLQMLRALRPARSGPWLPIIPLLFAMNLVACSGGETDLNTDPSTAAGASGKAGASGVAGSAGTAGQSGAAGAAGKAGAAGAAGKGGAGGTAGAGGKAGAGGTAGSSGGGQGGKAGAGGTAGASGKAGAGGTAGKAGAGGTAGAGGSVMATIDSIQVDPVTATVAAGTTVQLKATAILSDKTTNDVTALATWTSSADATAAVNAGLVKGLAAGDATITATYSGKSGTAAIKVPAAKPTSLAITPATFQIGVGTTQPLAAREFFDDGTSQDVSGSAAWSSSAADVAAVDAAGVVTGVAAGAVTITAQLGGLTATATGTVNGANLVKVAVTPVDPVLGLNVNQAFVATASYDDNTVADVTKSAVWDSSDPTVATIDASGQASTLAVGTAIVSATFKGQVGTSTVTVTDKQITSITISPATASLSIHGTAALTATATYSDGTTLDATTTATWESSDPSVAVSNAQGTQGQVTGLAAGTSQITATVNGIAGTATVTVTPATLTALVITPPALTLGKGTAAALTVAGTYDDGSTTDETANVTWTSSDNSIATVGNGASGGAVAAISPGAATITAQLGAVTATAAVTVTPATVASVAITPATINVPVGTKQALKAAATYTDGTVVDVTDQAVWSSSDENVGSVSNAKGARGLLSTVGGGSATLGALFDGQTGTASLTVTATMPTMLAVSPVQPTRYVGQQQQFQAILIFNNGTQQNVTQKATWTSSDTSIATMDTAPNAQGRAAAIAVGSTTITASYLGLTGQTTLTVSQAVVIGISISPMVPTITVGQVVAFQATAILSDGTTQNVTNQATWQSSTPSVAGIQTGGGGMGMGGGMRGRATGSAAGTTTITATFDGFSDSTTLTVTDAVIVSLTINPAQVTGPVGTTVQFTAQAIYSDGTSQDVTAQSTWQSDAAATASVVTAGGGMGMGMGGGNRGLATAIAAGTAHITASYKGLSATGTFIVTPATVTSISVGPVNPSTGIGVKVKLFATAILSDGTTQDVTNQATWQSANTAIADVSNAMGSKSVVTPIAAGTVTITATYKGLSGSTDVTVKSAKLMTIQVTPFDPTLPVGYATDFDAVGIYDDLSTQVLTGLVTWQSDSGASAAVSNAAGSRGRVTPIAAGVATISATLDGVTGSSKVTVTAATLQSITVSPATATLAIGTTSDLVAMGDFGGGLVLDITTYVTWLSDTPAVVNVSNAPGTHGQAKALSAGVATITANRDGKVGSATLTSQ
jgi:uncharacterized protein YjdB